MACSGTMLGLQIAGLTSGLATLALAPAASGAYLLIPITAAAEARMLPLALDRGAQLIGRGPVPGSYVIAGSRGALIGGLLHAGVVMLAAPAAGCGPSGARA